MSNIEYRSLGDDSAVLILQQLTVEGVNDGDMDGHIPRELLLKGTRIKVPLWPETQDKDELWMLWRQNGTVTRIYFVIYDPAPTDPYLYFDLTPEQMAIEGEAYIQYTVWKGGGGSDDSSLELKVTIDHTPLLILDEPTFPHATPWGYLNNKTSPALLLGAHVTIPELTKSALVNDRSEVQWVGYASLNGSGPAVPGTTGSWSKILTQDDIDNGYSLIVPFERHIRPLFDNDSALVTCRLYRGFRLIAESKKGLVKIDRVTPGENGPSGLGINGDKEMTVKIVPAKFRASATSSGALDIVARIDTLVDDLIEVSVWDAGTLSFEVAPFLDPQDGDEIDVHYSKVGEPLVRLNRTYELGLVAGRPPVVIVVPSNLFPEEQTPATPTRYQVQLKLYKGGGGSFDDSNIVEFVIDRTAPYEVKVPARRKNPPTPAVSISNLPADPARILDEAWMTANPALLCTVPVGYALRRLDDKLTYYLTSGTTSIKAFDEMVGATGAFSVPNAELRKLPNRTRISHSYSWQDVAGNLSATSASAPIVDLRLAQEPVLQPPRIPKTDPSRTVPIYLDDMVTNDVFAIVDQVPDGLPGDNIKMYVGDPDDPTIFFDFGTQPWGTGASFQLTYDAKLETLFGTSTEPKEVKVWYGHIRNGIETDGPEVYIFLAFQHVGPDYPTLPDLTNPTAGLVTVVGASGTSNTLLPGDREQPGKISVPVWFGSPDVVGGELIKFYINNLYAGEFKPFGGESEFSATLTAEFIAALPNATVQAYWTIQFEGMDKNIIKSPERPVVVSARKIDLLQPTIRIRNRDQIDCGAMDNALTNWKLALGIPVDATNLPAGTIITAHFEAFSDAAGLTPITGTADNQPYTIGTVTPNVAPVGTNAKFKLAQPRRGTVVYGKYWYTANIGGLQTSVPVIKLLDVITSAGDYCDRVVAPPPVSP